MKNPPAQSDRLFIILVVQNIAGYEPMPMFVFNEGCSIYA